MKNPFKDRCPACQSVNLTRSNDYMLIPFFRTKPIACEDCGATLDFHIVFRLYIPAMLSWLYFNAFAGKYIVNILGKDLGVLLFLTSVALLIFVLPLTGLIIGFFKPWGLVPWNTNKQRHWINVGSIAWIALLAVIFYATK